MLGESPPPRRDFFYDGRSTLLTHSIPVFTNKLGLPREPASFLKAFRDAGFYLDDFVGLRGAQPAAQPEALETRAGVARVASLISAERPALVLGVLLRIDGLVAEAVETSEAPETPWRCLHFPHHKKASDQLTYQRELTEALAKLK